MHHSRSEWMVFLQLRTITALQHIIIIIIIVNADRSSEVKIEINERFIGVEFSNWNHAEPRNIEFPVSFEKLKLDRVPVHGLENKF